MKIAKMFLYALKKKNKQAGAERCTSQVLSVQHSCTTKLDKIRNCITQKGDDERCVKIGDCYQTSPQTPNHIMGYCVLNNVEANYYDLRLSFATNLNS